jgi:hypothetical protein
MNQMNPYQRTYKDSVTTFFRTFVIKTNDYITKYYTISAGVPQEAGINPLPLSITYSGVISLSG